MNKTILTAALILAVGAGIAFFVAGGCVFACAAPEAAEAEAPAVASYETLPSALAERISEKSSEIVLVDVRTPEEYAAGHLENAILLPVDTITPATLAAAGLGEDAKDKEIYVYCRSGNRSRTAYETLSRLGYTNVKSVAGGMTRWSAEKLPYLVTN